MKPATDFQQVNDAPFLRWLESLCGPHAPSGQAAPLSAAQREAALIALRGAMASHSAPQKGVVSWALVARCAAQLLHASPDIKTACYAALARTQLEGAPGCAKDLEGLASLITTQ